MGSVEIGEGRSSSTSRQYAADGVPWEESYSGHGQVRHETALTQNPPLFFAFSRPVESRDATRCGSTKNAPPVIGDQPNSWNKPSGAGTVHEPSDIPRKTVRWSAMSGFRGPGACCCSLQGGRFRQQSLTSSRGFVR